ncbi:uncharacterized protein LOC128956793 [Oppia nitens]|uniref:uncharacterized protein LOC128956793 n=1 Tax=Oppia nitens TaxID=1686743 RepID=UPI0023DB4793|nr:uncharacterized protein LOC128956793 [Oppia nitens]
MIPNMFKFILFLIIPTVGVILAQEFNCPHDGRFENPQNKHSYYQCSDGQPYLLQCPNGGDSVTAWTQVFNGVECVDPYECPEIDGTYKLTDWGRIWYKCHDTVPHTRECASGYRYDGHRCVPQRKSASQHRRRSHSHYRLLFKDRNMVKFEFNNLIVTDIFDEIAWQWRREIAVK